MICPTCNTELVRDVTDVRCVDGEHVDASGVRVGKIVVGGMDVTIDVEM